VVSLSGAAWRSLLHVLGWVVLFAVLMGWWVLAAKLMVRWLE
jgi:hypothetical protein